MNGKTHAGIAAVTFVALYDKLPGGFNYAGALVAVFASLLPDIDHPKSVVNKYILPFKNKMAKLVLYLCTGLLIIWFDYLYANLPVYKALGISFIVVAFSSHREGLTHSLLGMSIFTCIVGYVAKQYHLFNIIYYFCLGYGMHLICDMATNRGVPLFYPFRNKKVKFPITYKTGSKAGKFFEEAIMIVGMLYVVYRLPAILK